MENVLYAGFGRADITPEHSAPLGGYGASHKRMSQNILSRLYASCIAFRQDGQTVLLFTQDLLRCNPRWTAQARQALGERTGVAPDHIHICSTHTHSAPDVLSELPCMEEYREFYVTALVEAACAALEDLAPATLQGGKTQTGGMTFVRHYLLADGSYAGPNFGSFKAAPIAEHAEPADQQLLLVRLTRQERPSILLANFQSHPTSTGGGKATDISADFVGVTRDNVEAATGMHFAYFTGAAGNLVMGSRIVAEQGNLKKEHYQSFGGGNYKIYGWRLAQYILQTLPRLAPMQSQGIRLTTEQLTYPTNREDVHLAEQARQMRKIWDEEGMAAAKAYGAPLGITSVFHAGAIIGRVNRPETGTMELNAVRIGELAFVTLPCEPFCAHGEYVKRHSPFDMTMVLSCANAGWNYFPTKKAYDYGCYESHTSYFARGCGEAAAEKLTQLLQQLK